MASAGQKTKKETDVNMYKYKNMGVVRLKQNQK